MINEEIEQFFKDILGNEFIKFRCKKNNTIDANGIFNENINQNLRQLNDNNYEIFFVVNSGSGYKDHQITKINAVFIDLDCGRNEKKEYFPLEYVKNYKNNKLIELSNFNFKPAYIIETRNGLHVYWLVDSDTTTIEQFNECEKRIIKYFGADKKVKNPARLMRVPGFYWCKDINNRYPVQILKRNNVRYNIQEIIESLPKIDKGDLGVIDRNNNNTIVSIIDTKNPSFNNLIYIKKHNFDKLHEIIKPAPIELNNHNDVYDYLKRQDLFKFLGLSQKYFCCLFHDDKNPSANIYIDPNTGYYWYKCFSESCGVTKDIISITENILKCSTPKALRFLRKVYKINYEETSWQKEQKEILEENKRLLYDRERFIQLAPETYKRISNYITELIIINDFAKQKVFTKNFTDDEDNILFYASMGYLAKICSLNDSRRLTDRIGLFSYLGLLNKLNENQIPEFLLKESKHQAAMKKQKKIISYYSIPSYCDNTLTFSENKAKIHKEKGYTMKGWGWEMILRCEGIEEADRVYPQVRDKTIPQLNEKTTYQMEAIALGVIEEKGWTNEKEILSQIKLYFKGQKKYKEKQMKRIIPEFIDKYNLNKSRLNKELKQKFGITDINGYPIIIYYK